MNKQSIKGFYRFTDFEHLQYNGKRGDLMEQFNIVQQVPDEGVEYEFMISFYNLDNKLSARAEIFDDAFVAFEMHSDLFSELSKCRKVTPDQIENILILLGYINLTKEEGESYGK